jgi:hypothetical protein
MKRKREIEKISFELTDEFAQNNENIKKYYLRRHMFWYL